MGTTKDIISEWFERGLKRKATHMIIVCDTFDYEDYPVYVYENENIHIKRKEYDGKDMQRIMEIYDLSKDKQMQLAQKYAFNY